MARIAGICVFRKDEEEGTDNSPAKIDCPNCGSERATYGDGGINCPDCDND